MDRLSFSEFRANIKSSDRADNFSDRGLEGVYQAILLDDGYPMTDLPRVCLDYQEMSLYGYLKHSLITDLADYAVMIENPDREGEEMHSIDVAGNPEYDWEGYNADLLKALADRTMVIDSWADPDSRYSPHDMTVVIVAY